MHGITDLSNKCHVKGNKHFPWYTGYDPVDTALYAVSLYVSQDAMLTPVEATVHLDP